MDAQALAASALQEAADARARGAAGTTRRERLSRLRRPATGNTQEPEVAIEGGEPREEAPSEGGEPDSRRHSLDAKA